MSSDVALPGRLLALLFPLQALGDHATRMKEHRPKKNGETTGGFLLSIDHGHDTASEASLPWDLPVP